MAETATTNTRPTRQRASRAAKPAAAKTTPAKAAAPAEKTDLTRFTVELEHVGPTKQYEKFAAPDNMKGVVVGNLYAPLGTARMAVLVVGANDQSE